ASPLFDGTRAGTTFRPGSGDLQCYAADAFGRHQAVGREPWRPDRRAGPRFVGLTAEGERVLAWAQRLLVDYESLQQELSEMWEGLVGQLRIGAIPVTLPVVPLLTGPFA